MHANKADVWKGSGPSQRPTGLGPAGQEKPRAGDSFSPLVPKSPFSSNHATFVPQEATYHQQEMSSNCSFRVNGGLLCWSHR